MGSSDFLLNFLCWWHACLTPPFFFFLSLQQNVKLAITKAAFALITVQSVNAYGQGGIKWPSKALNPTTLNLKRRRRYRKKRLTVLNREEGNKIEEPNAPYPWATIRCHVPQHLWVLQQNSLSYHICSTKILLLVTAHLTFIPKLDPLLNTEV